MYLTVVGAEADGRRLIDMAVSQRHEVTLIESDEGKARESLKGNDIRVLQGDIADDDILEEAEISRADAVIATTYDDSENLMAMVLAKDHNVETRVSLVNSKSHEKMFEHLGVQIVKDPAGIVARHLYGYVSSEPLHDD